MKPSERETFTAWQQRLTGEQPPAVMPTGMTFQEFQRWTENEASVSPVTPTKQVGTTRRSAPTHGVAPTGDDPRAAGAAHQNKLDALSRRVGELARRLQSGDIQEGSAEHKAELRAIQREFEKLAGENVPGQTTEDYAAYSVEEWDRKWDALSDQIDRIFDQRDHMLKHFPGRDDDE